MTKKATIADLGNLLGLLAVELTTRVKGREVTEFAADGSERTRTQYASSADLMAVLALLKQNSITVDPETSAELRELQAVLEARQKKNKQAAPDPLDNLIEEMGRGDGDGS